MTHHCHICRRYTQVVNTYYDKDGVVVIDLECGHDDDPGTPILHQL